MIPLDLALDRLLHKPRVLAAFLARGPAALDLAPDDAAALATLDRAELVRTATRIRDGLLHTPHRGSGSLLDRFPRTLAAHRDDLAALAEAFLDSPAFDEHRALPFAGPGRALEEAFFRFAEAAGLGDPATREAEFLAAILRALAVDPDPDFLVPDVVRAAPGGRFAVTTRSGPTLFAALAGRLVTGPITPFLADLLRADEPPDELARRHAVAPDVLAESLARLVELGLRAP